VTVKRERSCKARAPKKVTAKEKLKSKKYLITQRNPSMSQGRVRAKTGTVCSRSAKTWRGKLLKGHAR